MSSTPSLDLSSLEKAILQLTQSLEYYQAKVVQQDRILMQQIRAAAIQAFEYTYELCCKMLKRYLEMTEPSAETIEQMSFPNLIRTGSEKNLLLNPWSTWKEYRDKRNITSHTYDEKKAEKVFAIVPQFLEDAKYLLAQLQKRTNL